MSGIKAKSLLFENINKSFAMVKEHSGNIEQSVFHIRKRATFYGPVILYISKY